MKPALETPAVPRRDPIEVLYEESRATNDRFTALRAQWWGQVADMATRAKILAEGAERAALAQGNTGATGEVRTKALEAEKMRSRDIVRALNVAVSLARIATEDATSGEQLVVWMNRHFPGG